jgi:hypothetical protein
MLLSLIAGLALADDSPTLLLPGAAPMAAGTKEVGGEAIGLVLVGFLGDGLGTLPAVTGQLTVAPTDRLAVRLRAGGFDNGDLHALGTVEARYLVADSDGFRFAPWAVVAAVPDVGGAVLTGAALEVGGQKLVFDINVPLATVSLAEAYVYEEPTTVGGVATSRTELQWSGAVLTTAAATQLGVRWRAGDKDTLRVGLTSFLPTLGWRHDEERWYVDATVASFGVINAARVGVGAKF